MKKDNILVRKATMEDIVVISKWWNDGRIMKSVGFPKGLGIKKEKIIEIIKESQNNLMIIEVDKVKIGEFNYKIFGKKVEVGIKICEIDYQKKAYGKKVMSMMIDDFFSRGNIEKVILNTCSENFPAQKLYEKLGFEKIRFTKDSWKDQEGKMRSHIDYELGKKRMEKGEKT